MPDPTVMMRNATKRRATGATSADQQTNAYTGITPTAAYSPIAYAATPGTAAAAVLLPAKPNPIKRRAATAAAAMASQQQRKKDEAYAMYNSEDPVVVHAGLKARPHSGPLMTLGSRPRAPLAVAPQPQAQLAWTGITAREVASPIIECTKPLAQPAGRTRASELRKPRGAALQPPSGVTIAPRVKPRVRPSLSHQLNNLTKQTGKLLDSINRGDVHSTHHDLASAPYANLSPTSAGSAAAASKRPPGMFDPFPMIYPVDSPFHLLSVSSKRFVVGKLSCRYPSMVHFKRDRVCYIFAHPHQENVTIMMELGYADMLDVRTSPSGGAGSGSFSFRIGHHLPAFDNFGDYEPHLRAHRLTIEFNSQFDLQQFKKAVLPAVLAQATTTTMTRR